MEHVEDVRQYVPGGYHPVDIGDIMDNGPVTYTVMHKLGHGGFSTVWLVKRQCKQLKAPTLLKQPHFMPSKSSVLTSATWRRAMR